VDVAVAVEHVSWDDLLVLVHGQAAIHGFTHEDLADRQEGHEEQHVGGETVVELEHGIVDDNAIVEKAFQVAKQGQQHLFDDVDDEILKILSMI
jgi:hypothetical protein